MPNEKKANVNIDIPLDGVGETPRNPASRRGAGGSCIDIPLDGEETRPGGAGAGGITRTELEIVNRHHAEIKELHRRAREEGNG